MKKMIKLAMLLMPLGFIIPIVNYIMFGDILDEFIDCFMHIYLPSIAIILCELILFIIYRRCFKK